MKEVKDTEKTKDTHSTKRGRHFGETGKSSMRGPERSERKPVNHDYAGKVYSFKDHDPKLQKKYPEGVKFNRKGYPDFSPYAKESVKIDMKGNHSSDYTKANEAAGLKRQPKGTTWHHHQDCKTMQLLPTDLHDNVRHSGGVSALKNEGG